MTNINTIIFDFGGVLVDWNPRYLYRQEFEDEATMEYFLSHIGWEEWNLQQDKGRSLSEGTKLLQHQFPEYHSKIQLFYEQWEQMLKGDIPENVALLEQLKGKYRLYGLTNWSAETFPKALQRFSFFTIFDGIVVSGQEKLIKPDEQIFKLLMDRYQINPETSLFIDDNIHNIDAAITLGFSTIHIQEKTDLKNELYLKGIL